MRRSESDYARTLVDVFGISACFVVAVVMAGAFLLAFYLNMSETLAFKARVSADRAAQFIGAHEGDWQGRQQELAGQVRLPMGDARPVRQKLHAGDGLILEDGPQPAAPVMSRSAPIVVNGATLGTIETTGSLRPTLGWAAAFGALNLLLGLSVYMAVRAFPLRRIDRILVELQRAEHDLSQQNEALRLNQAQFSNALRMARAGHWEYDVPSDRFTFNDNFYRIFRLSVEEAGGYTMSSADYARRFVHPDDMAVVGAEVKAAIETTDPDYCREFEHRMIYGDGEPGYIAVRFFIVKDESGRTIRTYGVNQDITERKRVELALADSRAKLDAALSNMSQGLCMFDADERLMLFNPRFAELWGVPPEAVRLGATPKELLLLASPGRDLSPADQETTLALRRNLIGEREPASLIHRLEDGRCLAVAHQPLADGGFVVTLEDVTGRLAAEAKVEHLAHYDSLTDLPNRVTFYEQLERALSRRGRSESIAVLSLDLDRFKNVNDTLGHAVGDLLLQAAAERMRSCVRNEDIVARLGGDEFAIALVGCETVPDISTFAGRLVEAVGAPYDLNGHHVPVGASIGIAIAPDDGEDPSTLLKNADLALYRAKADGRGVYRFFEVEMDARMQARRALELDIQRAIEQGEFENYYQPVVDAGTGQITRCEALVRWQHPTRGMISPEDFIPLAEETGLIVQIGDWVLRQACRDAMHWPKHIGLSVNLSPAQFKNARLVDSVVQALAASGLAADRLELEITELVLIQDNETAFRILHQLRNLGARIAMDDFGTGYSSLGYLRSFPFDRIKIDKSFVGDLPDRHDSVAIVRAVVGLGSSLGIRTTAEGVETEEQLASVRSEGCDEVQGFIFSRPQPADAIQRLLEEKTSRMDAVA